MNAVLHSRIAYADPNDVLRTPRDSEYDAFARATRALTDAAAAGPAGFSRVADALSLNRRLWTILATDLASDANLLPPSLRSGLLGLAQFVLSHGDKVLDGRAKIQPLIDVNMALMRGLRGQGATR